MACEKLTTTNKQPCDSYIEGGFCTKPDQFRCVEYIKYNEPELRQTTMTMFSKCPKLYYWYEIEGLEIIEKSYPILIGSYVDKMFAEQEVEITEKDKAELWLVKARAIVEVAGRLNIIPTTVQGYIPQHKFNIRKDGFPHISGTLDFIHSDGTFFCELKTTSMPDNYLNKFFIEEQIGTYFFCNDNLQYCRMLVIRVPELEYDEKKETIDGYYARCVGDIIRRPAWYFQGYYNKDNTWGVNFYRQEMNLESLIAKYRWIAQDIQRCAQANYWMQRRTECFNPTQCSYYKACEIGISDDRYKKRTI